MLLTINLRVECAGNRTSSPRFRARESRAPSDGAGSTPSLRDDHPARRWIASHTENCVPTRPITLLLPTLDDEWRERSLQRRRRFVGRAPGRHVARPHSQGDPESRVRVEITASHPPRKRVSLSPPTGVGRDRPRRRSTRPGTHTSSEFAITSTAQLRAQAQIERAIASAFGTPSDTNPVPHVGYLQDRRGRNARRRAHRPPSLSVGAGPSLQAISRPDE